MDHGDIVRNAWMCATKYITDETTDESWRKMVVLGDIDCGMEVQFFLDRAGLKLRLRIEPGDTFDKMVKTYRSALESKGLEPKETPEMFDERMARTAHEREEQFLAIADRMRRRREARQAERDE